MAIFRRDRNYDDDRVVRRDINRPVVIHERERGGWGWLATLLTLALVAVILWATGILDADFSGRTTNDSIQGGVDVQVNEPDRVDLNNNNQ